MARPPRLTPDGILDAASDVVLERWRDTTVADVAARLGVEPGAVYYRFRTKDALLGSLWLRSIRRFHAALLPQVQREDPQSAAVEAAATVIGFCRENRADAVAMTLYRQQDLVVLVDGELRDEVAHANDEVVGAMRALAVRRFGRDDDRSLHLLAVAAQENPYGLVRRYLRDDVAMPAWLEDAVRASCAAILALGDA